MQSGKARHMGQGVVFARVQFRQMRGIPPAQEMRGDQRRSRIGLRAVTAPDLCQGAQKGVIGGQPAFSLGPQDAGAGFARLGGLGPVQPVKPASGMGFQIGQRLVLAGQVIQGDGQQRVLVQVGQVSRMIGVLVTEHGRALARRGWREKAYVALRSSEWLFSTRSPSSCSIR